MTGENLLARSAGVRRTGGRGERPAARRAALVFKSVLLAAGVGLATAKAARNRTTRDVGEKCMVGFDMESSEDVSRG